MQIELDRHVLNLLVSKREHLLILGHGCCRIGFSYAMKVSGKIRNPILAFADERRDGVCRNTPTIFEVVVASDVETRLFHHLGHLVALHSLEPPH